MGRRFQRAESPQLRPTLVERKRSGLDIPVPRGKPCTVKRHLQALLTGLERSGAFVHTTLELVTNPIQLLLGFLAVGNIVGNAGDAPHGAGTVVDRKRPIPYPPHGTVGPHDAVFFVIGPYRLFGQRGVQDPFTVLRMYRLEPGSREVI